MMFGGGIIGLIVIVLVGVAVYYLITHSKNIDLFQGQSRETPLDILKKRFARGEISKEEFDEMKKDL